ncbi:DNA/RNA non-specific endonuclease [Antribacter gilvus]|uniref:DNA/RNA non-specific endonuclease n=1 Tax=Antribacter gilvus TaxID=2304675 RepID=UPI000F7B0553|nr:DNA/RNA non-specific endonuclease [Antribacter gilvus]
MTGYDPAFLGTTVPLPAPEQAVRRLDYTHFTVLLDPARRLAAVTSCAVDGASLRALPRSGTWHLDQRVPVHEQAGPELYRSNPLDRGHLVRRLDPVWGDPETARRANGDTFAYTNAAPQVARFNQSKELWNGLEDHVLEYAGAYDHRIVVHTGPVLADDDPVYRGVGIPRLFWKVVAWAPGPEGLAATAFVLDQTPQLDEAELEMVTAQALAADRIPPLGPYRTYQVPVADVPALTRLDLGPLREADVLSRGELPPSGSERAPEVTIQRLPRARRWAHLRTREQIRLG